MALATVPTAFSDALPPTAAPITPTPPSADTGLTARLSSVADGLSTLVDDLDPGLLMGADAASLYGAFCRLERLVVAGKTLLAPRIAASGQWEVEGHRSPAALLAAIEGGSAGQAKRTLQTGQRLAQLPSTEEALRRGILSGAKVAEIAEAATVEPDAEVELLAGSDTEPLHLVKERCQRVRATAAGRDPMAAERKIHAERYFRSWTDGEGAFCYQGRDSAERGARLMAALGPVTNRLRDDRRAAASEAAALLPKGTPRPTPESNDALRSDALFLLLDGRRRSPRTSTDPVTRPHDPGALPALGLPTASPDTSDLDRDEDLTAAAPPATIMVRVDLETLRRGRAGPDDLCELDGHGPVPVPVVAGLADDAFINLVFTEAGDIRAVSHLGRTINSRLRTALAFRDRCCVVPGCGVAYSLEIDHVVPLERGGPTEIDNLALLCRHHHRMKTYDGWELARTGRSDAEPQWTFTPLPPFGQEPGLGSQAPPEPVPRQ